VPSSTLARSLQHTRLCVSTSAWTLGSSLHSLDNHCVFRKIFVSRNHLDRKLLVVDTFLRAHLPCTVFFVENHHKSLHHTQFPRWIDHLCVRHPLPVISFVSPRKGKVAAGSRMYLWMIGASPINPMSMIISFITLMVVQFFENCVILGY